MPSFVPFYSTILGIILMVKLNTLREVPVSHLIPPDQTEVNPVIPLIANQRSTPEPIIDPRFVPKILLFLRNQSPSTHL